MRRTITVTQRKGGVGKTTIAICIAAELARRGNDVVLVDSDAQRSASQWAEPGNLEFPVYEMALGQISVSAWAREVRNIQAGLVVIDTAPNAREMGASIALANLILVPCTPSGLDLDATLQTLAIIDAAREHRRDQIQVILVPNRLDRRTLEGTSITRGVERVRRDRCTAHRQSFGIRPLFHHWPICRKFRAGRCRGPGNPATRRRSGMGCAKGIADGRLGLPIILFI